MAKFTLCTRSIPARDLIAPESWHTHQHDVPVEAILFAPSDMAFEEPEDAQIYRAVGFRVAAGTVLPEQLLAGYEFEAETGVAIFKEYVRPYRGEYGSFRDEDGTLLKVTRIPNACVLLVGEDRNVSFEVCPNFVFACEGKYYRDDFDVSIVTTKGVNPPLLDGFFSYKEVIGFTVKAFIEAAPKRYRKTYNRQHPLRRFLRHDIDAYYRADPFKFRERGTKQQTEKPSVQTGRRQIILHEERKPELMEFPTSDICRWFPLDQGNTGWAMFGLRDDLESLCPPDDDLGKNGSIQSHDKYEFHQHRLIVYRASDAWLFIFLLDATLETGRSNIKERYTHVKIALPMVMKHTEVIGKTRSACFPSLGRRGMALINQERGLGSAIRLATDMLIGMVRSEKVKLLFNEIEIRDMPAVKKNGAYVLSLFDDCYSNKLTVSRYLSNLIARSGEYPDPKAWNNIDTVSAVNPVAKSRPARQLLL